MNEYDIEENGFIYHVTEYPDGTVTKVIVRPVPSGDEIDEWTQRELEMASNIEYLVALAEGVRA